MTVVNDARSVLRTGASTVLSNVRSNKTARRFLPERTQKLMKQWNRRLEPRRAPVLPLVLVSVGLSIVGTVTGILVSRYVAGKRAEEAALADLAAEEGVEEETIEVIFAE